MTLASLHTCSGCGSCAAICPHKCIEMISDSEGFAYPRVDPARCVSCGLCRRACPVMNALPVSEHADALAAKHCDTDLRMRSSSGGVFPVLAEHILAQSGAVCAAVYDKDFSVVHEISRDRAEIPRFRGAKYAQSRAEQCFPEIKKLLTDGVPVLFVGTPCQVAGLRAYLGSAYENLLLVDMICHGVPSPAVWKKYMEELSAGHEASISAVNLRSKVSGWSRYGYSVEIGFDNGAAYCAVQGQDWFLRGFTGDLYLRPSCSNCSFKGVERCSDLTLGDCWGIWETHPEFDDNNGTSLLLIQSKKGGRVWEAVRDSFEWISISTEEAVFHNPSAVRSSAAHPRREEFFERLESAQSVSGMIKECLLPPDVPKPTLLARIKRRLLPRK